MLFVNETYFYNITLVYCYTSCIRHLFAALMSLKDDELSNEFSKKISAAKCFEKWLLHATLINFINIVKNNCTINVYNIYEAFKTL